MHHMQWLLDISEGNLKYCGIFFFLSLQAKLIHCSFVLSQDH